MTKFSISLAVVAAATASVHAWDDCLTTGYGPLELHWGVFDWHEPIDWLITSPSLSENATLQFKSKDEYEGDPGFGYYSQTRCDNNAGFIGLAADPESQYGGISGDLCLTASALEQSDITVSLQACEYAEGGTNHPIPTQNFQIRKYLLLTPDYEDDTVYYKPFLDEEGVLKLEYSAEGYADPEDDLENSVWAITLSGAD